MHVLVLSTGNPALEQALTAAGHTVTILQPEGHAHPLAGADVHTITHWDDTEELNRLHRKLPAVDAVATIDEQAVVAAAHLRQQRHLPGLDLDGARAYTDKAVMKTRLAAAGLPVAGHRVVTHADQVPSAARALGWPVVIKPRGGMATVNTFVVRDLDHLRALVAEGAFDARPDDPIGRFSAGHALDSLHSARDGFLVEQFLDLDQEYFCDLYVHRGSVLLTVPGRYNEPLLKTLGGNCENTALAPDHPEAVAVADLARRAAAALGKQTGAIHCEILRDTDGRLYVGEAAARPGGGHITELAARMYGFDLPAALAALALDQRPTFNPAPRYPALTAVLVSAPPGIVTHLADKASVEAIPGVLDVALNLTVGQPVPGHLGTLPLAGRVLYVPRALHALEQEVAAVRAALDIRVTPADALV